MPIFLSILASLMGMGFAWLAREMGLGWGITALVYVSSSLLGFIALLLLFLPRLPPRQIEEEITAEIEELRDNLRDGVHFLLGFLRR